MKILVVGGGGREHAIIKKLKENPNVTEIFACPGNGGIAKDATCVDIGAKDIPAIADFAVENKIDFCVVAPDDPLVLGCVDALEAKGIPCFGPNKNAAIIEGSKVFSKNLMQKYNIPTADYAVFADPKEVIEYIRKKNEFPTVIKADGLALGKGVIIAQNLEEAEDAVKSIMEDKMFGESGNHVVVEEFLTGPEVSVLAFTDGKAMVPMVSSMDHKRALDGDKGLNTGGMGTFSPCPFWTKELEEEVMNTIMIPTMNAMNAEGRTFKGCLYFGLMRTNKGMKVVEYNSRFGDPETQVVLPMLRTDLMDIFEAVTDGRLSDIKIEWDTGACVCVVLASGGYPSHHEKGKEITIGDVGDCQIVHAGTAVKDGKLVTNGGRVLGVVAKGATTDEAREKAYAAAKNISWDGMYFRHDIGIKYREG